MKGILFIMVLVLSAFCILEHRRNGTLVQENMRLQGLVDQSGAAVDVANVALYQEISAMRGIAQTAGDTTRVRRLSDMEQAYMKCYINGGKPDAAAGAYLSKIRLFDTLRQFLSGWNYCPAQEDCRLDLYFTHNTSYQYDDTIYLVTQLKPMFRHDLYSLVDWNYKPFARAIGNEIHYNIPAKHLVQQQSLPVKTAIEISVTLRNNVTREKSVWKRISTVTIH